MADLINPFTQLYIGEIASPDDFVKLFSPVLVKHFLSLFQKGNIVLRGTQGSGKSMLLNLLKPEIFMAYHRAGSTVPLPDSLRRFISGGINLTRSDAVSIGQRPMESRSKEDDLAFPMYFADFVNYWVVSDLLKSVETVGANPEVFGGIVNLSNIDSFARELSNQECWFGYLNHVTSLDSLRQAINSRLTIYRKFHQYNIERIPDDIRSTKTPIGEPISRTAVCLKSTGVIQSDVPIFVRIDQLEFLLESSEIRRNLGRDYRRIINKALSTRDPAISYKLGVRTYAWEEDVAIYGSETNLELQRDYRLEDIDEVLRRRENRRTWTLPIFAEDVFERRLFYAGYAANTGKGKPSLIRRVFGPGPTPVQVARKYCLKATDIRRALRMPENVPEAWVRFLENTFHDDPLSATLAAAWVQQKRGRYGANRITLPPPDAPPWPWDQTWWKKERIRQALMQLSARCAQRMSWAGDTQILALSGNNILIFISLCQYIWDTFLRAEKTLPDNEKTNPVFDRIPEDAQSIGILTASKHWYNKITELPGGHERKRFVDVLGTSFRRSLLDDQAMSYPGHNGFSSANDEWLAVTRVREFLKQAVNYGVLIEAVHTTKTSDRKPRTKWYLNPIYSPYFSIPETHVKEPLYVRVDKVLEWLNLSDQQAKAIFIGEKKTENPKTTIRENSRNSVSQLDFLANFDKRNNE